METRQIQESELHGQQLLYKRPEILNSQQHAELGVRVPEQPFAFAAKEHLFPLLVHEITQAAQWYPIVFAGEQKFPLAVMGIKPGKNLFIADSGETEPGAYLPAYLRRYPFTIAEDTEGQKVVCIDAEAEHFAGAAEWSLFSAGEPTEQLRRAIDFCDDFERSRQKTLEFVELLTRLDLFEVKHTVYKAGSGEQPVEPIAEYYAVAEERIAKLPVETLQELAANGALGQIYAHVHSLQRWEPLMLRHRALAPRH